MSSDMNKKCLRFAQKQKGLNSGPLFGRIGGLSPCRSGFLRRLRRLGDVHLIACPPRVNREKRCPDQRQNGPAGSPRNVFLCIFSRGGPPPLVRQGVGSPRPAGPRRTRLRGSFLARAGPPRSSKNRPNGRFANNPPSSPGLAGKAILAGCRIQPNPSPARGVRPAQFQLQPAVAMTIALVPLE